MKPQSLDEQETNRESLVNLNNFVFPPRGPDYPNPVFKYRKAPNTVPEETQTDKEEIIRESLVNLNNFVFPPRGPDYQKPAVSKYNRTPKVVEEEVETTYEEAIAATYAILTRNERKCTCPPEPGIKVFGNTRFWMKRKEKEKDGMIVLKERNPSITKVRHYEGCILCTPTPSPRSSEEDIGREFFSPSKQNPGPPPSSPPPFPNLEERSEYRPDFARRTTLVPVGFSQLNTMFEGFPNGAEPSRSNRSIESPTEVSSQLTEVRHNPYNSQSYHDGYRIPLDDLSQPLGRAETHVSSPGLQDGGPTIEESQYIINLSLRGSTQLLTGANAAGSSRGRRQYPDYDASSRNLDSDGTIPTRRGSIFNRGTLASDLENGRVKCFPFSSRPIFPGNHGIMRLPDKDIPRPSAGMSPQAIGADGMYETIDLEMVDPNEPESAIQGGAGAQTRFERAKGVVAGVVVILSSPEILKNQVHKFWKWCRVQKWAIFLLGVLFCITIASIT